MSGVTEQTRARLALYLGLKEDKVDVTCAGLNDFSWVASCHELPSGKDLIPRIQKEMKEDDREALAAQYIDWYGAIPAGAARYSVRAVGRYGAQPAPFADDFRRGRGGL